MKKLKLTEWEKLKRIRKKQKEWKEEWEEEWKKV